jgi:hypothetical protein
MLGSLVHRTRSYLVKLMWWINVDKQTEYHRPGLKLNGSVI